MVAKLLYLGGWEEPDFSGKALESREKKQANQECPNPLPPSPGSVNNTQFAPVPLAFFFYCQLLI